MRTLSLVRVGALAPLLLCSLLAAPLPAGQARLVEGAGPGRVVIEASEASADEILSVLAAHFGFGVERSAPAGQTVRFSGRLQGSLDALLERLLRHEGHIIVRSRDARAGIGRILLLEAKGGTHAPGVAGPMAAIKAKLRERDGAGK